MLSSSSAKPIGVIGYDGVAAIDMAGALEAFKIADGAAPGDPGRRYRLVVAAPSLAPFTAESGLRILPDVALKSAPAFDTIIVPGGHGLREDATAAGLVPWLRERAAATRRMVSVCTGLYGLAATGLLDGRRATTHWRHASDAQRRFPKVRIEPDALFIRDGAFYTSAGMTAGIDLALSLIEEDHGPALSLAVARMLVVFMKRPGGQLQYSEPLRSQSSGGGRFADLVAKVAADLGADWSVEAMAAVVGLSPRQFSRRARAAFGSPPASFLETLRLDEARLRLAADGCSVDRVARAAGFSSADVFRRAFERRFGVTPSAYRARFTTLPEPLDDVPSTD
jgi:transcriptional regulator GlxA family with amidase domain